MSPLVRVLALPVLLAMAALDWLFGTWMVLCLAGHDMLTRWKARRAKRLAVRS